MKCNFVTTSVRRQYINVCGLAGELAADAVIGDADVRETRVSNLMLWHRF